MTPERLAQIEDEWDGYSPGLCGKHIPELITALREAWGVMEEMATDFEKAAADCEAASETMAEATGLPPNVAGFPVGILREWANRLKAGREG